MNKIVLLSALASLSLSLTAQDQLPPLHVEGRWLCNEQGEHVNLHGFGQTYSPWFNEQGNGWGWGYNEAACLRYNQGLIDKIIEAGWEMDWMRLHMDPHWSNDPNLVNQWQAAHPGESYGENHIEAFSEARFKQYLRSVFIPMAKYANQKGMYVVMRPPGVCPHNLELRDDYHKYLLKVWKIVCSRPELANNPGIMFELANEPIEMKGDDGQYTSWSESSQKNNTKYFKAICDSIRSWGANNILWVPGLGYQSQYAGFAKYPVAGENIGYAVHCYPGWYGSDSEAEGGSVEQGVVTNGHGYVEFQAGWNNQVMPCANKAPILITEMDWAPKSYNCSWGKATTGVAGGVGFGANFKYIMDKTENVSWMLFTGPEHLAKYNDQAPDGKTFLTDPEACVRPIYRWYKQYKDPDWTFEDLSGDYLTFPGTDVMLNPSIWETGSWIGSTGCLTTGQWGFGGWQFAGGLDLSAWKYLVIKLKSAPASNQWSFRMFDENNYWSTPSMTAIGSKTQVNVVLNNLYKDGTSTKLNLKHIYIAGFWSPGGTPLYIDKIYLTNNSDYSEDETALEVLFDETMAFPSTPLYDLMGRRVAQPQLGQFYLLNGKKVVFDY